MKWLKKILSFIIEGIIYLGILYWILERNDSDSLKEFTFILWLISFPLLMQTIRRPKRDDLHDLMTTDYSLTPKS